MVCQVWTTLQRGCRRAVVLALVLACALLGSCAVTEKPTLELTPGGSELAEGDAVQLVATRRYPGGNSENVTAVVDWLSTDAGTIRVSNKPGSKGQVEAVGKIGRVFIRAKDPLSGVEESVAFTLRPSVIRELHVLPPAIIVLARAGTYELRASATMSNRDTVDVTDKVSWSTSNAAVATVSDTGDQKGVVTGVFTGSATITAIDLETGAQGSTVIAVAALPELLALKLTPDPADIVIRPTAQTPFTATAAFSDGTTPNYNPLVKWTSSDPTVATVALSGQIFALKVGETYVSVEYAGGGTAAPLRATALLRVSSD